MISILNNNFNNFDPFVKIIQQTEMKHSLWGFFPPKKYMTLKTGKEAQAPKTIEPAE